MTCKDCLHYEACIEMANDCGRRKIKETIASKCEYFTDRFEWVHLPSADVVPLVRGVWELCFEDWRKQIAGDKCSACGFEHYGSTISHYRYCPNCGARMGGDIDKEAEKALKELKTNDT